MEFFGDVEPFLRENDNLSPVCRASLLEIFDDPVTARDLDIELAATIDAGKHFVQATYFLEGDVGYILIVQRHAKNFYSCCFF